MCLSRGDSLQRLDLYDSSEEIIMNVDTYLRDEIKQCKKDLLYIADLYSISNEVQKRLNGKMASNFNLKQSYWTFKLK